MMKQVVVYGGKGALGNSIVKAFRNQTGWQTICVDLHANPLAHVNISKHHKQLLQQQQHNNNHNNHQHHNHHNNHQHSQWLDDAAYVEKQLIDVTKHNSNVRAVICVAGGMYTY